jgi:hypothetical protein
MVTQVQGGYFSGDAVNDGRGGTVHLEQFPRFHLPFSQPEPPPLGSMILFRDYPRLFEEV